MKFSVVAAVAACAAVATAQRIEVITPTKGSIWNVGEEVFIEWRGNCDPLGKAVAIELRTGPAENTRFIAPLGTLDCSGANATEAKTRHSFVLSADVPTDLYSLTIQTTPEPTYTNQFNIVNKKSTPPPPATTTATEQPKPTGAASSMMAKTGAVAAAALAAAAYLF
ncbi:hypothetical protein BGZ73_005892 [Actinomortierella ambigua]|nr:hypothetical protein BGZ73_005892 [Actinomortierella ambigua]